MAIDFPNSPSNNDQYTVGTTTWMYNGTAWVVSLGDASIATGAITADKIASDAVTTAKILDANVTAGKIASGAAVSNIGYTPANIASPTFTGTVVLPSTTSIGTVTSTEIGYVGGVTSAIQAQLDSKLTATTATTSGRNLLINGDFEVWQRGTAVQSNAGQGAYAADRWCGAHQYQNSRTQRTAISSPPSGLLSQYALRSSSSTTAQNANGTRMRIAQKVESLNSYRLRSQQVTLSFWVRFSNATVSSINNSAGGGESTYGNFGYSIGSYTSTTDSATNTSAADTATSASITNGSLPTTWTKYTLTGTVSATANNVDVVFGFASLGSTTSADTEWFELAQIQLEVGSVATPFEFEDYGTTLAKCQRYYQKAYNDTTYAGNSGIAVGGFWAYAYAAIPNGIIYYSFLFPTRMRTTPTVNIYSYEGQINRVHASGVGEMGANTAVAAQIGNASCAVINNSGSTMPSGYLYLGFYVASAEL